LNSNLYIGLVIYRCVGQDAQERYNMAEWYGNETMLKPEVDGSQCGDEQMDHGRQEWSDYLDI